MLQGFQGHSCCVSKDSRGVSGVFEGVSGVRSASQGVLGDPMVFHGDSNTFQWVSRYSSERSRDYQVVLSSKGFKKSFRGG